MRLRDLLGDVDVREWRGDPDVEVTAVVHDSRMAGPGALFCCVPGLQADGHDHAPAAVARGARALLVERALELDVAQARVALVRAALGPVAARLHGHPSRSLRVIGITGTNGKTTTSYLLEAIAAAAGERVAVIGTLGVHADTPSGAPPPRGLATLTTPEAPELHAELADLRDAGVTTVAMEVSSHALARHRVDGVCFRAAVFTNLSRDHLDFHGSLDAYFEAKASLFDPARSRAAALNLDDPAGSRLLGRCRAAGMPVRTFAISHPADVGAEDVVVGRDGTRFVLVDREAGTRVPVHTALSGAFNVANALAAAAGALAAGLPSDALGPGLSTSVPVAGRLEPVGAGQPFLVLVDYAHTPEALVQVLDTARVLAAGGRVVVVFGAGGERDRAKRPQMGRAVGERADLAIVTTDNPRREDVAAIADAVARGVRAAGAEPILEPDRRAAIRRALTGAGEGDVVLIAGKGHESGQTTGTRTEPFDDRAVARAELEALGWS